MIDRAVIVFCNFIRTCIHDMFVASLLWRLERVSLLGR